MQEETKISLGCPRLQLKVNAKEVEEEHRGSEEPCRRNNEAVGLQKEQQPGSLCRSVSRVTPTKTSPKAISNCLINKKRITQTPGARLRREMPVAIALQNQEVWKLVGPLEISTFFPPPFTQESVA